MCARLAALVFVVIDLQCEDLFMQIFLKTIAGVCSDLCPVRLRDEIMIVDVIQLGKKLVEI